MHANNRETIYSAESGDWTQARMITVSGSARTVPMSHRDKSSRSWHVDHSRGWRQTTTCSASAAFSAYGGQTSWQTHQSSKIHVCQTYVQSSVTERRLLLHRRLSELRNHSSAWRPPCIRWNASCLPGHHIRSWLEKKAWKTTKQLVTWRPQSDTRNCSGGLDSSWWLWRVESATVHHRLRVL